MKGKMVLDTELLVDYENKVSSKLVGQVHRKLVLPYSINWKQWREAKRIGLKMVDSEYNRILSQLANDKNKNYDLEELASESLLKIILTKNESKKLPYVHYKKGMINKLVTISLAADENRDELKKYLQLLCSDATKVTICDNYFSQNWNDTVSIFYSTLPKKRLIIEYVEVNTCLSVVKNGSKITDTFVKGIHSEWSVQENHDTKYINCHDRYLLIDTPDGKIEVLLSSGFEHIWKNNPKEITCMFREVA